MGDQIKLPPGAVLESDSSQMKLPPGATLETPPQAPPKPGFLERVTQGIPKSWHEAAATFGIPTSLEEAKQMASNGTLLDPAATAAHGIVNQVGTGVKEGAQEAYDAGQNVAGGGPLGANLGKAAYGGVHAALQAVPGVGPVVETAGQDVQDKNYAGAAGGVINALAQYGMMRGAPEAENISTSKATAPVRATVKAVNAALKKAPGTIGMTAGTAIGAASHIPYGAEIGAGIGGWAGKELLPQLKLPGENVGLPDRVNGGPDEAPWFEKTPSSEIGADATRENKPYAGENYGKPWEAQHDATPRNKEYAGEDLGKLLKMPPQEAMKIPLSETPQVGTQAGADVDTALFKQASAEMPNASLSDKLLRAQELKTKGVGGNGIPGPATVEPSPSSEAYSKSPIPEGTRVPGENEDLTALLQKSVEKVTAPQYDAETIAEARRQLAEQGHNPEDIDAAIHQLTGNAPPTPQNALSSTVSDLAEPQDELERRGAPRDLQGESDRAYLQTLEQKIATNAPDRLQAIQARTDLLNRMNGVTVEPTDLEARAQAGKTRNMSQPRKEFEAPTSTRKDLTMTEEDFLNARKRQRTKSGG